MTGRGFNFVFRLIGLFIARESADNFDDWRQLRSAIVNVKNVYIILHEFVDNRNNEVDSFPWNNVLLLSKYPWSEVLDENVTIRGGMIDSYVDHIDKQYRGMINEEGLDKKVSP